MACSVARGGPFFVRFNFGKNLFFLFQNHLISAAKAVILHIQLNMQNGKCQIAYLTEYAK